MKENAFKNYIGQKELIGNLKFTIEAHDAGKAIPHFLFVGAHGNGKTSLAREFCKNVKGSDGKIRKYLEINCSTITSLSQFVEKVLIPHIVDRETNLVCDEAHCLPKSVTMFLLSVLNTEKSPVRRVAWGDAELEFDFCRQSIHLATTEPQHIFKPLKNRMEVLAMAPYKLHELQQIIAINLPDIEFEDNILEEIASSVNGTARSCVLMAKKIGDYCSIKGRKSFDTTDFRNLSKMVGIKAFGLDSVQIAILRLLLERGEQSLNELSATLNLSRTALQMDHEHHLMSKGLMKIDGKRQITHKGRELIKTIKE